MAWKLFKKNPVFGHGLHSFRLLRPDAWAEMVKDGEITDLRWDKGEHIHNDLAEVFLELGLVGAVLFYGLLGMVMFTTEHPLLIPVIVAMLLNSTTYFALHRPFTGLIFWVVLGMACQS